MLPAHRLPPSILTAIQSCPLPLVPEVLVCLLEAVDNEGVSAETLADLIARDPVIAARVLASANSAAFRRSKPFVRLIDCVQLLGMRLIRTIATCLAVQQSFDPLSRRLQIELSGFWRHSLAVAETARILARDTRVAAPEEAYLGGLLHDLGELLMLAGLPTYGETLSTCPDEQSLPQLEHILFGCSHAATGAWLVEQWRLDSTLADAILFHHCEEADIAQADPLSRLLWVAHCWIDHGQLPAATEALLGCPVETLLHALGGVREQVGQVAAALGITPAPAAADARDALPHIVAAPRDAAPISKIDEIVRNLALMQPLQTSLLELQNQREIYLSLRESARILFGIDALAFLTRDAASHCLRSAEHDSPPAALRQLTLALDPPLSLAAQAIEHNQPCASAGQDDALTVGDLQLMRALDVTTLLCLPMHSAGQSVGVMVIGLAQDRTVALEPQLPWITRFADMAARTLAAWENASRQRDDLVMELSQRMERQARRLAHEAGNPLGIIKNYLAMIERKLDDAHLIHNELSVCREEIDRVTRLIDHLSTPPDDASHFDLNALARDTLAFYEQTLLTPRGIRLDLDLSAAPISLAGNPDTLRQILLNLIKNAATAMDQGGRIVVTTHAELFEGGRRHAELRVEDNGPGLPDTVRASLAQPTLPAANAAHGIGLGIVSNLINGLDGKLICLSRPGKGTIFSILIPLNEPPTSLEPA